MRIEQQPNGSYVKRINNVEQQIIDRLYKEIGERKSAYNLLESRLNQQEAEIIALKEALQAQNA